MKEILMVTLALLLGIGFGMVVHYFLDSRYMSELKLIYEKEKDSMQRTLEMREKMHINTFNRLQNDLLERDKMINSLMNELDEVRMTGTVKSVPVQKKDVLGSKEWFNALTDIDSPVGGDKVDFGGLEL